MISTDNCLSTGNPHYLAVLGVGAQVLPVGCCRGLMWGEAGADPYQTQLLPAGSSGPTAGYSQALQPRSCQFWESIFSKNHKNAQWSVKMRSEGKKVWEAVLQTSRLTKKEGGEMIQVPVQKFPYSLWRRAWWSSLSPWHGALHWRTYLHCTCEGVHAGVGQDAWRKVQWEDSPRGARVQAGAVACGEHTLEQSVPEGLHPVERTHAGAVLEELQPLEGPKLELLMKDCLPWERPHVWVGEKCEEEGESERNCYGLTATPIPHPACTTPGKEVEQLGMKEWSWAWEEEWGQGRKCFEFCLCFYHPTLFLIGNKVNSFSLSESVLPTVMVTYLPVFISAHEFSTFFSPLVPLRRWIKRERLGRESGNQLRSTHPLGHWSTNRR